MAGQRTNTLKLTTFLLILGLLVIPKASYAQLCMPESQPQSNSGYSYIRAEVKALQWIRSGLTESQKMQPPTLDDPQRLHKNVELYATVNTVSDDYDCAISILEKYKDSKNESIHESVESFLLAINTTKQINKDLMEVMESLNKAQKQEDIDQVAIAKMLGNVKSMQKDVRTLALAAAKMSTFGILRIEGGGDDAKPIAFLITSRQRTTLLADVRELASELKKKKDDYTYVDGCAAILLSTLTMQLQTSAEK
jgi:hypothetical protein